MSTPALPPQLDPARPFVLFGALLANASQLTRVDEDPGQCTLCGLQQGPRLTLESNDEFILGPEVGVPGALGVSPIPIREWERTPLTGRRAVSGTGSTICVPCAQAGRVAFGKDTELGAVDWRSAVAGRTGGIPVEPAKVAVPVKGFFTQPLGGVEETAPEGVWVAVLVPSGWLLELVRTPGYLSWQGETWLFCCRRPMVFCGEWGRMEFHRHAVDGDGRALFESITGATSYGGWDKLGPSVRDANPDLGMFVFHCPECFGLDGYVDPS